MELLEIPQRDWFDVDEVPDDFAYKTFKRGCPSPLAKKTKSQEEAHSAPSQTHHSLETFQVFASNSLDHPLQGHGTPSTEQSYHLFPSPLDSTNDHYPSPQFHHAAEQQTFFSPSGQLEINNTEHTHSFGFENRKGNPCDREGESMQQAPHSCAQPFFSSSRSSQNHSMENLGYPDMLTNSTLHSTGNDEWISFIAMPQNFAALDFARNVHTPLSQTDSVVSAIYSLPEEHMPMEAERHVTDFVRHTNRDSFERSYPAEENYYYVLTDQDMEDVIHKDDLYESMSNEIVCFAKELQYMRDQMKFCNYEMKALRIKVTESDLKQVEPLLTKLDNVLRHVQKCEMNGTNVDRNGYLEKIMEKEKYNVFMRLAIKQILRSPSRFHNSLPVLNSVIGTLNQSEILSILRQNSARNEDSDRDYSLSLPKFDHLQRPSSPSYKMFASLMNRY